MNLEFTFEDDFLADLPDGGCVGKKTWSARARF